MDRRSFLAIAAAATLSGASCLPERSRGESAAGPSSAKPPNVLLLMADQHKRSCIGAYGDAVARTPNLDALARDSVRFTAAYCNNPICTPSRASMMTGLYSHHLEAQNNATPYLPTHPTMAHHFNRAGYMTALIGKMHFVDAQTHGFEYRLGFNDWLQYLGPKAQLYADEVGQQNTGAGLPEVEELWHEEGDPWRGHRTSDDREGPVSVGRVSLMQESDHFESFVARESVRFLRNFGKTGQPFFLVSSFLKPHDPFMPAPRFAEMFKPEEMQLPSSYRKADKGKLPREVVAAIEFNAPTPEVRDPVQARRHIAMYYACLAQMDDCLGKILTAIREMDLVNDTIVCYTSDHGEMLGELGLWQKFQFYEGSCGVPLMFRVPGRRPGVCRQPVSLISLSATLAELAGVSQVAPNDGTSLASWVKEPSCPASAGPVFAEYGLRSRQPKCMIREGQWKYTYWAHDIPELYDLSTDPDELHNLAGETAYADTTAKLRAKLLAWHCPG